MLIQRAEHYGRPSYHAPSFAADFQHDPSLLDLVLYCPPLGPRPPVFSRDPCVILSPDLSSNGVPSLLHSLHLPAMVHSQKIHAFPASSPSDVATNRDPRERIVITFLF